MDEYGVTDGVLYVTPQKPTLFDGHNLRNRSTLNIGVLGYIGIVYIRNTLPKFGTFLLGHSVHSRISDRRSTHLFHFKTEQAS